MARRIDAMIIHGTYSIADSMALVAGQDFNAKIEPYSAARFALADLTLTSRREQELPAAVLMNAFNHSRNGVEFSHQLVLFLQSKGLLDRLGILTASDPAFLMPAEKTLIELCPSVPLLKYSGDVTDPDSDWYRFIGERLNNPKSR